MQRVGSLATGARMFARHAVERVLQVKARLVKGRLLRALLPAAAAYCGAFAASEPDCAVRRRRGLSSFARRGEGPPADVSPAQVAEAAICRRAAEVLRFGSGTFSAFLVGDGASRPPSAQFLSCPEIERAASLPHSKS